MFKQSISAWPADKSSKDYYILFTTRYFLQNDTIASLKVIDEKIKNDSVLFMLNPSDIVLKGNIYLANDEFEKAKYNFQRSLGVGQTPDAWLGLSYLELKENKLQEANNLINKAYELNKNYYLNYALFGIITLLNNQKDAAKDALENALQLKPDDEIIKEVYNTFFAK